MSRSRIVWRLTVIVTMLVTLTALITSCSRDTAGANATTTPPPQLIESLESIELGGVEQWVFIRGDRTKPVLLWLHGGPGAPLLPTARYFDTELTKQFFVVHWDQRGAGKSFDPTLTPEMLTVEQFVADTQALVLHLRQRFNVPKIYAIGHSWGAMLGALTVARYPELFYAYIGVSQPVSISESQQIAYPQLLNQARASNHTEAINELEALGPPPWSSFEAAVTFGKWNLFFGRVQRNLTAQQLAEARKSSVYTPEDFAKLEQGQSFSLAALYPQLLDINLFEQVPQLDVPVYFFHGRYDGQAPGGLIERYYNALKAPRGKQLVWFEDSAHLPMYEEPVKFHALMQQVVAETYPALDQP